MKIETNWRKIETEIKLSRDKKSLTFTFSV